MIRTKSLNAYYSKTFNSNLEKCKYVCNICGWAGKSFQSLYEDINVLCPRCGSYERHRAIVLYLEKTNILPKNGYALEIGSGAVSAFKIYLENQGWKYRSLDLYPGHGDFIGDISNLPFPKKTFDLIICFHVLEHVKNDFIAIAEMSRIIKDSGLALIQVPYDDSKFCTAENDIPTNPAIGSEYYYHHKRDYGLDIIERLRLFWSCVAEIHPLLTISEAEARKYGFQKNFWTTFFCSHFSQSVDFLGELKRNLLPLKRYWMIEQRAYQISLNSCGNSNQMEDWLQAESEINNLSDDKIEKLNIFSL
ncbi:MAG: methyltransferase domain-containing protein [Spirulina sp.]